MADMEGCRIRPDVSGQAHRPPPSVVLAEEPAGPVRVRGPESRRKARRGRIERAPGWFDGHDHGD